MAEVDGLLVRIEASTALLRQQLGQAERRVDDASRRMERSLANVDEAFQRVGAAVERVQVILGAVGIVASISDFRKAAEGFQTSMAQVSTLLSDTSGMQKYSAQVKELSRQFGQMPIDQAKALYEVLSAGGASAADAMNVLVASNKLAIGGVTQVQTAADGLTSTLNSYGAAAGTAANVADAFFAAAQAGKTNIEQLSASIGSVAPLAAQTGVSLDELLAATAALTAGGISTSTAMDGLRNIISQAVKPTDEAAKAAKALGLDFSAAALASKGLSGFLADVAQKTGGSSEQMANLFGGVESLLPAMALTGTASKDFAGALEEMRQKAGAADEAYRKMADTSEQTGRRLAAQAEVYRIELGDKLLAATTPAMAALSKNFETVTTGAETLAVALSVGLAARAIPAVITSLGTLNAAILANPATAVAVGVGVLAGGLYLLWQEQKQAAEETRRYNDLVNGSPPILDRSAAASATQTKALYDEAVGRRDVIAALLDERQARLDLQRSTLIGGFGPDDERVAFLDGRLSEDEFKERFGSDEAFENIRALKREADDLTKAWNANDMAAQMLSQQQEILANRTEGAGKSIATTTATTTEATKAAKKYADWLKEINLQVRSATALADAELKGAAAVREATTQAEIAAEMAQLNVKVNTAEARTIAEKVRLLEAEGKRREENAAIRTAEQDLAYAQKELSLMGQAEPYRERALASLQIQQKALEDFGSLTSDNAVKWIELQERIADTTAVTKFHEEIRDTSRDIADDWSEAMYEGITGGKLSSIVSWFKSLLKRLAVEALSANIILPITTQIVGSIPGLFGIQSGVSSGASGALGQLGGMASNYASSQLLSSVMPSGLTNGLLNYGGSLLGLGGAASSSAAMGGAASTLAEVAAADVMAAWAPGGSGVLSGAGAEAASVLAQGGGEAATVASGGLGAGGSALASGLSAAGIGFGIGMLPGMFGANKFQSAVIGGLGGGVAGGALAGTAIMPGIGTVAGAAIGAIAGIIGGVLGGKLKPSDKTGTSTIDLDSYSLTEGGLSGKKFSQENRDAASTLATSIVPIITALEGISGADISGGAFTVGVGSRDGLYLQQGNDRLAEFDTSEEGTAKLLEFVTNKFADDVRDKLPASFSEALGNIDWSSAEAGLTDLRFLVDLEAGNAALADLAGGLETVQRKAREATAEGFAPIADELSRAARLGVDGQYKDLLTSRFEEMLNPTTLDAVQTAIAETNGQFEAIGDAIHDAGLDISAGVVEASRLDTIGDALVALAEAGQITIGSLEAARQAFPDTADAIDRAVKVLNDATAAAARAGALGVSQALDPLRVTSGVDVLTMAGFSNAVSKPNLSGAIESVLRGMTGNGTTDMNSILALQTKLLDRSQFPLITNDDVARIIGLVTQEAAAVQQRYATTRQGRAQIDGLIRGDTPATVEQLYAGIGLNASDFAETTGYIKALFDSLADGVLDSGQLEDAYTGIAANLQKGRITGEQFSAILQEITGRFSEAQQAADQMSEALKQNSQSIAEWIIKLRGTDAGGGSAQEQYDFARTAYDQALIKAQGGDTEALASLTNLAEMVISARKLLSASGRDTRSEIDAIVAQLAGLGSVGEYLKGLPGFAGGGAHMGGLRIVGERGWEIEATGASRIWNQEQIGRALMAANDRLPGSVVPLVPRFNMAAPMAGRDGSDSIVRAVNALAVKVDRLITATERGDADNVGATEDVAAGLQQLVTGLKRNPAPVAQRRTVNG